MALRNVIRVTSSSRSKVRLIRAGEPAKSGKEFIEWKMSVPDILGRIDAEWTRLGRTPNIGEVV